MKLLHNILVPTDFSESSLKAVDVSIELAKKFNSKITLLHVTTEEEISEEIKQLLKRTIKTSLNELKLKIESNNIQVSQVIIEKGVAFEKIIQVAQDKDVNVIITGSGTKKENEQFKLGTNVEKLIRKNQIPLWVVKNQDVKPVKKILCPVDFSDASKRALVNAITMADYFNAELNIIHVFEPVMVTSARLSVDYDMENEKRQKNKEEEFNAFLSNQDFKSVTYYKKLVKGTPYIEILRTIKNSGIDLLIMGTTGKTALSRLLMGSVAEKVTRELPCNFITTKAQDITNDYLESNLEGIESILNPAKELLHKQKYEQAIEKFTIGLKQYPDNIPMLKGIIKAFKAINNHEKVSYYKRYAKEVIKRLWGDDFVDKIELE